VSNSQLPILRHGILQKYMQVSLPLRSFPFFKIAIGIIYFVSVFISPKIALASFFIALLVGRAHGLGAWLGMWRGNRITWKFVIWMSFLTLIVSYLGTRVVSFSFLSFFTTVLFAVHFFFDEFELQDTPIHKHNIIAGFTPFFLVVLYLFNSYYKIGIPFYFFIITLTSLLALEVFLLKKIDWFFIQSKVHLIFIWLAIVTELKPQTILGVLLTFHYFFWFIYPVYKLHKYKREERDGFIMILLLLVSTSVYFATTNQSYGQEVYELAVKAFLIGTIIHILSTAPFGYLFGLKRSRFAIS
jgi:hypothetical protein